MNKITFLSIIFFVLTISPSEALAQFTKESVLENSGTHEHFNIGKDQNVWMLTYFRQRYPTRIEVDAEGKVIEVPLPDPMQVEQLHIALSTDGRHWTPLNNNNPVWDQRMRDPYVRKGPDGIWRLLATGGGRNINREKLGPICLYVTSKDLINWQVEDPLPLMKDVRDESGALARNIWAPEWFYDDKTGEYMLFWSSSYRDAGWKESRLWYCKTRDWKTFTTAKVLFAPPYSVIDGTLQEHEGTYYLFHKEEEFGVKTGERRAMRVATSKKLEGPYSIIEGHLNGGQIVPVITEGPTVMKDPLKQGWLLLYDYCMTNRFGVSYSPDLIHWTEENDVSFPSEARHGTVSLLNTEEAKTLIETYPSTNKLSISREDWGSVDSKPVYLYTLTNSNGVTAKITNYGCTIVEFNVPDKNGQMENITLGLNSLEEYQGRHPCFGCVIGRCINRISGAKFTLDNIEYTLTANSGKNHIHGGNDNFSRKVWNTTASVGENSATLSFTYVSADMEEGYPGNLTVKVDYVLNNNNELKLIYTATTDKPTVVNLSNHSYFNLSGCKDNIRDHQVRIYADKYTPSGEGLIPTGEIVLVEGTPYDLRQWTNINDRLPKLPSGGFDNNYCVKGNSNEVELVAELYDPKSGRLLQTYTTEPGVQFYMATNLRFKTPEGNSFSGACFETQHYPDSPNNPNFPSTVLRPGETYKQTTIYKAGIRQ